MRNSLMRFSFALVLSAFVAAPVVAQHESHGVAASSDSAAVVATIHAFHAALAAGDSVKAISLLTSDVVILESGGLETLAQYRAHHLPADINFAKAVPAKQTVSRVSVSGSTAWAASTSVSEGQANGRAVNSAGAELMILTKVGNAWKINAIHWSSRRRNAGG